MPTRSRRVLDALRTATLFAALALLAASVLAVPLSLFTPAYRRGNPAGDLTVCLLRGQLWLTNGESSFDPGWSIVGYRSFDLAAAPPEGRVYQASRGHDGRTLWFLTLPLWIPAAVCSLVAAVLLPRFVRQRLHSRYVYPSSPTS